MLIKLYSVTAVTILKCIFWHDLQLSADAYTVQAYIWTSHLQSFLKAMKNNRHFQSSVFSHTWSMQYRGLIFCCQKPSVRILKSFCLTYIITEVLLSMFLIRRKSFASEPSCFFHCSKFSSSPGGMLTVSCSHASSWCRSYGWTDFLKVVGQLTMSAMSRRTPRDKGQLLVLGKLCVKILKLGAFPDFSARARLTCYW